MPFSFAASSVVLMVLGGKSTFGCAQAPGHTWCQRLPLASLFNVTHVYQAILDGLSGELSKERLCLMLSLEQHGPEFFSELGVSQ